VRLGSGTHIWLRVAEWRDGADDSVFFFRFHSGTCGPELRRSGQGRREGAAPAVLPLEGFVAVPVAFLWKRKKVLDAWDVIRASHCAAGSLSGLFCSPIDSPVIIAFPRETIVILSVKIRGLCLCPYPFPDPALAAATWQPPAATAQSPVPACVRSRAKHRDQEPAADPCGCL